jgi:hypothetical protein
MSYHFSVLSVSGSKNLEIMDNQELIAELLDLAGRLGVEVRQDRLGGNATSLCLLKGRAVLFVDLDADDRDQVAALIKALAGRPGLDQIFIRPQVRQLFDDYCQKK